MAIDEHRMVESASEFESVLTNAVLTAFARGVNIERSWDIGSPVADAPSWHIRITRRETAKESPYDPPLVEDS